MNPALLPASARRDPALRHYATDPRAADWRFLLPALPRGAVLCIGGALSPVPLVLAQTAQEVIVVAPAEDLALLTARTQALGQSNIRGRPAAAGRPLGVPADRFDLVAALRPRPGSRPAGWRDRDRAALAARVAAGGQLYLEIARPALLQSPTRWRRRLARLGFRRTRAYWPKPDFDHCEALLPLGDRQIQEYYLAEMFFTMSAARRILRAALRLAVICGLFERLLPGYMVFAQRAGEGQDGHVGAD